MSDTPATVTPIDAEAKYFVNPRETTKIAVASINGWIEVRDEISIGEERRVFSDSVKGQTQLPDGSVRTDYDMQKVSFGTVLAYLVDWSLKRDLPADPKKKLDVIDKMPSHVYLPIEEAVRAHAARVKEGNALTPPESGGSPTSASAG